MSNATKHSAKPARHGGLMAGLANKKRNLSSDNSTGKAKQSKVDSVHKSSFGEQKQSIAAGPDNERQGKNSKLSTGRGQVKTSLPGKPKANKEEKADMSETAGQNEPHSNSAMKVKTGESNREKMTSSELERKSGNEATSRKHQITSGNKAMSNPQSVIPIASTTAASASSGSSRLDKYKKKLDGAKFRMLNESLYTGEKSATGLSSDEFEIYHQGFAGQVSKWPTNPVDVIISKYLRRSAKRKMDVGDFGCGDAKIAAREGKHHNIHSFDLVAANDAVVACDIARDGVPLSDDSLDLVIFSLSLMGEEVSPYLKEALRTLRTGGRLIVAEVKSRFSGEGETSPEAMHEGLRRFVQGLEQLGFRLVEMDAETNTMFVLIEMRKVSNAKPSSKVSIRLKSCEYKRR